MAELSQVSELSWSLLKTIADCSEEIEPIATVYQYADQGPASLSAMHCIVAIASFYRMDFLLTWKQQALGQRQQNAASSRVES